MLTSLSLSPSTSPVAAPTAQTAPAPRATEDVRPNVEWWEVGDQRFDSTADLVKAYVPPKAGVPALYHWRQETSFGAPEKRRAVLDGAKQGALMGGIIGGVFGVGMNILGVIGTVLTGGMLGVFGGVSLVAPALICAGVGAVIGALEGPSNAKARFDTGTLVDGQLQTEVQPDGTSHLVFYVDDRASEKVDLNAYQNARPGAPSAGGDQPWWIHSGHVARPDA